MKSYFVSDLHLKSQDSDHAQLFLKFLKEIPKDLNHLILLGDVFDLWIGDHVFFQKRFSLILDEIKKLKSKGVEIHYFEGNHDLHLKRFWQNQLGIQVHPSFFIFKWPHITIRAEHGDQMNPHDTGYLFLRKFLRTPPMEFLSYHLPGPIVSFIGNQSSHLSRNYTDKLSLKYQNRVKDLTRNYAQSVFKETPFDLFVCGHTHVFDDFSFQENNKDVRSINLGTWLDQPCFLKVEDQTVSIEKL